MASSEKLFREIFVEQGVLGLYEGSKLFFVANMLFNGFFHLGYSLIQKKIAFGFKTVLLRLGATLIVYFGCNFGLAVLNRWKYKVRDRTIVQRFKKMISSRFKKKSKADMAVDELKKLLFETKSCFLHEQWMSEFWVRGMSVSLSLLLFDGVRAKF
jgi:hypothetical protein